MDNENRSPGDQITSIADAVIKLQELRQSDKNLNEPDIEEKFARLSLAFKTDKFTLNKRLDLQLRQRDVAENDIEGELKALRESLNALNQLCSETDMREIITKTQQNVDIVQQATKRMCGRAETYGAIQQEERMNCTFETMLNYVEHLKLLHDKEHIELEEYRRLLAEHNLLPDEQSSLDDDSKRILPPRSYSLSSSSKPELMRRGSLGMLRGNAFDYDHFMSRANNPSSVLGVNYVVRQKMEPRTRLLSAVCLLSGSNHVEIRSNGTADSPKSRRSSLPVGPLAHHTPLTLRTKPNERKQSQSKSSQLTRTESEESTNSKPEADCSNSLEEKSEDTLKEDSPTKDSSDIELVLPSLDPLRLCVPLRDPFCDTESNTPSSIPDLTVPVTRQRLYTFSLLNKVSAKRAWRWDSVILHARYTLSALLATAAMCTLVLTFLPNHYISLLTK